MGRSLNWSYEKKRYNVQNRSKFICPKEKCNSRRVRRYIIALQKRAGNSKCKNRIFARWCDRSIAILYKLNDEQKIDYDIIYHIEIDSTDTDSKKKIEKLVQFVNDLTVINARPFDKAETIPDKRYTLSFLKNDNKSEFYFHISPSFDTVWHKNYVYTVDPEYFKGLVNDLTSS